MGQLLLLVRHWYPEREIVAVADHAYASLKLFAPHRWIRQAAATFRQVAWYHKTYPTFADALALVRKELWAQEETFHGSLADAARR